VFNSPTFRPLSYKPFRLIVAGALLANLGNAI